MKDILETCSLCPTCYRHLDSILFEYNGTIKIKKECPEHGKMEYLVEHSAEFYYKIHSEVFNDRCNVVLFDVTDKCNLNCKHCYHLPDNDAPDKPISQVIDEIRSIPPNFEIILAGAEPTVRKDIAELVQEIKRAFKTPVGMLTNGVKFSDKDFTKLMADSGIGGTVLLGINCDSDDKLKTKQLEGLSNLSEFGLLPRIGYTASNYECLDKGFKSFNCIPVSEKSACVVMALFSLASMFFIDTLYEIKQSLQLFATPYDISLSRK